MSGWLFLAFLIGVLVVAQWSQHRTRAERRESKAALDHLDRMLATTCPVCGKSREFWRDGRRMLAPPHKHVHDQTR